MSLMMTGIGEMMTNLTLHNENFRRFLNTEPRPHFDVVLMEIVLCEALLGLGPFFNAPLVGISTFGASKWTADLVGTPNMASYVVHPFMGYSHRMSFWQRLSNSAANWLDEILVPTLYMPKQRALYDLHFGGPGKPTFDDVRHNVSMVLLNTHVSLGFPRPYAPNMIEAGGWHIDSKQQKLPANLQRFLDEAKGGAIYFSLGSNVKSTMFADGVLEELFHVFAELADMRIIFKGEAEDAQALQKIAPNALILAWCPQQAILAHPNVKLFITHGGLLSTTESIHYGVPVIGIPIFGDQMMNMRNAEVAGYAVTIDFLKLNGVTLRAAIKEALFNPTYDRMAKTISSRYHDRIETPLQTAVYWIEYVARHKECTHLRSPSIRFPFYKLHNLDVSIVLLLIVVAPFLILKLAWTKVRRFNTQVTKKQKFN